MKRRMLCACVAALALAGSLLAGEATIEGLLPADAMLALCYYGDNPDLQQTAMYQLMQEPEVKEWLTSLRQTLAGVNALAAQFLRVNPAALKPLLGCRVGLALLPTGAAGPMAGPPVDLLLVARVGGADAPPRGGILGFLQQVARLAGGEPGMEQKVQVAGLELTRVGPGPMRVYYGFRGELFLLATSEGAVEQALTDAAPKLATVPGFQRSAKLAGSPVLLALYNHAAIMERFGVLAPPEVLAAMQSIGLGEVSTAGIRLGARGRAMVSTLFVQTAGERRGLVRVLAAPPVDRSLLKLVPRDSSVAYITNVDMAALYDGVVGVAQSVGEPQGFHVREAIAGFEAQAGISLRGDLVGSLGRGTAVTTSAPSLLPALIVSQALQDGERFDRAMAALVRQLDGAIKQVARPGAGAGIKSIQFGGHTIRYLVTPGVPVPLAPCYVRVGDRVVLALSPIHLKDYLAFLDGKEPSILDDPGFQEMVKLVPKEASSISYSRFGDAFVDAYQMVGPMLALAHAIPNNPIAIDLANLPSVRTVRKHMFGAISYTYSTDDLIVHESQSPLGFGIVGPAPAGAPAIAVVAIGAGMLLPALARARGEARRIRSMNNLRQVGMACMMYAQDHENALPPNLAALFEAKMLADPGVLVAPNDRAPPRVANRPCSYVYLLDDHPGLKLKIEEFQQAAAMPLAWERLPFDRGMHNVLFLDGHVEAMTAREFARRLARVQEFLKERAKKQGEF